MVSSQHLNLTLLEAFIHGEAKDAFLGDRQRPPGARRRRDQQYFSASEVKAFTSCIRNTRNPGPISPTATDAFVGYTGQLKLGPDLNSNTGHTEWPDGRVHHSGITTVFTPNSVVPYYHNGRQYDIDFNSVQEGKRDDQGTYAAITARSYHSSGILNCLRLDGSALSIADSIDLSAWRSFGTIARGE